MSNTHSIHHATVTCSAPFCWTACASPGRLGEWAGRSPIWRTPARAIPWYSRRCSEPRVRGGRLAGPVRSLQQCLAGRPHHCLCCRAIVIFTIIDERNRDTNNHKLLINKDKLYMHAKLKNIFYIHEHICNKHNKKHVHNNTSSRVKDNGQ